MSGSGDPVNAVEVFCVFPMSIRSWFARATSLRVGASRDISTPFLQSFESSRDRTRPRQPGPHSIAQEGCLQLGMVVPRGVVSVSWLVNIVEPLLVYIGTALCCGSVRAPRLRSRRAVRALALLFSKQVII